MPAVSVIIPVYNGSRHIMYAVNSVLHQTLDDLEVVVVDDGSTDSTAEVLAPYRASGKVRYVYRENAGPAAARNTGIDQARGKYIAFLDADDLWLPRKLEYQREYLRLHPGVKAVHCDLEIFRNGKILDDEFDRRHLVREGWIFEPMLLLRSWIFLSCLLVERTVFETVGLFREDLPTAEDTNLLMRITRSYPVGFVDRVLVKRRLHEANISQSSQQKRGTFKNLEDIAERFPELRPERSRLMRRAHELRYLMFGCTQFRQGQYGAARQLLHRALRLRILNLKALGYYVLTYLPPGMLEMLRSGKQQTVRALKAGSARLSGAR